MGYINIVAMIATIAFGLIGWLKPRYTMKKLDLETDGSTLGLSEIRAANGALFVGLGLGALLLNHPLAFSMVGFAYAGAAVGRLTGIVADGAGSRTAWTFLAAEIILAVALLTLNLR